MIWPFILLFLCLQLGIGYWASKFIKSEDDYFLAGRQLGVPLVSFSIFATWFGAETCIGTAGAVFTQGLSGGRADPLGYTICLLILAFFFSKQFWRTKMTTLGDLFHNRFGKITEILTILIIIPSTLLWASAQVRAFGQIINAVSPINLETAMIVATIFVVSYTFLGGLLGDIYTDFVQGILIIIGLTLTLVMTLWHYDFSVLTSAITPERLTLLAPGESFFERLDRWAIPVLGSLITQEMVSRLLAAKSEKVAFRSSVYASILYLAVGSIPLVLGLFGPAVVSANTDPEQFLMNYSKELLHPVLFVVFVGAIVSAILSTIDSLLLAVSALFTHNILVPQLGVKKDKTKVLLARAVTMGSGLICLYFAMNSEGILALVEDASAFGTAGILVITCFGLFTNIGSKVASLAALIASSTVSILSASFINVITPEMLPAPFLTSCFVAVAVYLLFSPIDRARQKSPTAEGSLRWQSAK